MRFLKHSSKIFKEIDYDTNDQSKKDLFYASLKSYTDPLRGGGYRTLWDYYELLNYPDKSKIKELRNQKYKINKLGYRGDDFNEHPSDILAAGCSQTWGLGCPDEYIWPSILSKDVNKSINNIGYFGKSVPAIVQMIFTYFKEIGNPKYVFVCFPDLYRFQFPIVDNFWESNKNIRTNSLIAESHLGESKYIKNKPKYSKAPYLIEDMITYDYCIWQSIIHIQMLEQYCASSGIVLSYGFWDSEATLLFNKISNNTFYKNYISLEGDKWTPKYELKESQYYTKNNITIECHNDLINKDNEYFWHLGLDRYKKNFIPHIGTHRHIHIAEIFKKKVIDDHIRN